MYLTLRGSSCSGRTFGRRSGRQRHTVCGEYKDSAGEYSSRRLSPAGTRSRRGISGQAGAIQRIITRFAQPLRNIAAGTSLLQRCGGTDMLKERAEGRQRRGHEDESESAETVFCHARRSRLGACRSLRAGDGQPHQSSQLRFQTACAEKRQKNLVDEQIWLIRHCRSPLEEGGWKLWVHVPVGCQSTFQAV